MAAKKAHDPEGWDEDEWTARLVACGSRHEGSGFVPDPFLVVEIVNSGAATLDQGGRVIRRKGYAKGGRPAPALPAGLRVENGLLTPKARS